MTEVEVLACLLSLRRHQRAGQRSPHKSLLVLYALGQLAATGSSAVAWSAAVEKLAELIRDHGPPSVTPPGQRAAYPFTRLRSDGIWSLDHDVPMDRVQPLTANRVVGRLDLRLEDALRDPEIAAAAARQLVEAEFPPTVAPDVLMAVGLDPDTILTATTGRFAAVPRVRRSSWTAAVLTAWNRQCAFCGLTASSARPLLVSRRRMSAGSTSVDLTTRTTALPCARCTTSCSTVAPSVSVLVMICGSPCRRASPAAPTLARPCTTSTDDP